MEEGGHVALTWLERVQARFWGYLITILGYVKTALRMVSAFLVSVYVVAVDPVSCVMSIIAADVFE